MDISTHLVFWVVAWCWMAVAFITAACAIILGAKGLDKKNRIGTDDH
jgi:hypothetical protein